MFYSRGVINCQTDFWKYEVLLNNLYQSLSAQKIILLNEIRISRVLLKVSSVTHFVVPNQNIRNERSEISLILS